MYPIKTVWRKGSNQFEPFEPYHVLLTDCKKCIVKCRARVSHRISSHQVVLAKNMKKDWQQYIRMVGIGNDSRNGYIEHIGYFYNFSFFYFLVYFNGCRIIWLAWCGSFVYQQWRTKLWEVLLSTRMKCIKFYWWKYMYIYIEPLCFHLPFIVFPFYFSFIRRM